MIYVFVEGLDDEKFFNGVLAGVIRNLGEDYSIIQYAKLKKDKINSYLNSVSSMDGCDYIFFGDADGVSIEERKRELDIKYVKLDRKKIRIVQFEIESWYYAGASRDLCKQLKMKHFESKTDELTKEHFNSKLDNIANRKYVLSQIIEHYSITLAKTRNRSFKGFMEHIS